MEQDIAKEVAESTSVLQEYLNQILHWIVSKAGSVIIVALFLFIGFKLVRLLIKVIKKSMERHHVEASVGGFIVSFIRILLYILVFVSAAGIMGFDVTSFVTILGTASLSVGLALQGSLSNLAGGVLLLVLKPFVVGDYIIENAGKQEGTVVSIDIFYTRLRTADNKIVVIPNGNLSASSLINVTTEGKRRLDIVVGISYDADIREVRTLLLELLKKDDRILKDEKIDIFVDNFDASAINMGIRVWTSSEHYWQLKWDLLEKIKYAFDEKKIAIPYQQVDIHVTEIEKDKIL